MATGGPETPLTPQDVAFQRQFSRPGASRSVTGYTDTERQQQLDQRMAGYDGPQMRQIMPNDSSGMPDIDAAIAAGNAASAIADPNAVQAQPQQSTTTAAVDPTAPQQPQQMGGGLKFTTKPANFGGQRMTAQDFVPHPDPYSIQAYGQTFSQPAFNLPAPAIAARLQGLAQEQAELNKVTEQAFAQDKKPVVPPQYSRSFNNLYTQGEDELRKGIAEQYGGREDLAAKALANKDPNNRAAHRAYLKFHKDMDDIGRVMTHNVDEAMLNIQQMKTGERPWDQASFDASQDLLEGFNKLGQGGLGDVQKLLTIAQNYDRTTSLPYTLAQKDKNGMSLDEHIRNNMAQSFTKKADGSPRFWVDKAGRFTVLTHEDLKTAETILDGLTEELWPRFDAQYDSKEAFRTRLGQLYPVKVELKVDDTYTPSASSAAAAQKPRIGNFQVAVDNAVPKSAGHTGEVLMFPMVDKDNKPFTETMTFQGRAGGAKTLIPDHLSVDGNGNIFVVGPNPLSVETQTANAGRAAMLKIEADDLSKKIQVEEASEPKDGVTPAQQQADIAAMKKEREKKILAANDLEKQTTKVKESEAVRVDAGNEERIRLLFGDEQFNMVKENAEKFKNRGRTGSLRNEVDAFVDPTKQEAATDYKPEQINSALKKAGAAKGKKYTMEDWNNASPEARANMMKAYGQGGQAGNDPVQKPAKPRSEYLIPGNRANGQSPEEEFEFKSGWIKTRGGGALLNSKIRNRVDAVDTLTEEIEKASSLPTEKERRQYIESIPSLYTWPKFGDDPFLKGLIEKAIADRNYRPYTSD